PSHRSHPSRGRNRSFKATPTCPTCADAFLQRPARRLCLPEVLTVRGRSTACKNELPPTLPHCGIPPRTPGHCPPTTTWTDPMLSGQPVLSPALIIVCVIMAITAGLIYWVAALGSPWTVPWAAIRGAVQLAAVAGVLAAEIGRAHV